MERWARVECQFRCVACSASSPLNHIELGGRLSCTHCGVEQSFDGRVFGHVLSVAHDVVDLAGSDPAVRHSPQNGRLTLENPFKHVGVSASEWQWTEERVVAGRAPLVVRVSPGHPLCGRCKVPLVVQAQVGHTLLAACQRCGARETHALPAAASLYPAALGALAAEHRTDRRQAHDHVGSDGVASLACPQCGAPLVTDLHSTTVLCRHCGAQSLVSSRLWFRLGVREPKPEPIWVLFSGRSERRRKLEATDVDSFELELQARARAVLAGRTPSASPQAQAVPRVSAPAAAAPVPLPASAPVPRRTGMIVIILLVSVLGVLVGAAGLAAYFGL